MGLSGLKTFPLGEALITSVHGAHFLVSSTKFIHHLSSGLLDIIDKFSSASCPLLHHLTCPIPSKLGVAQCCKTFQSLHAHLLESSAFQDIWAAFLTESQKFLLSVIIPKAELQHPMSTALTLA